MKIIPAIDLMEGQVVRLYKGDPKQKTVYSDDPMSVAQKWQEAGADMLHIVDLDATIGIGNNLDLIEKITKSLSIPVEVAGGLRNEAVIDRAISFATRIVIGTLAFKDRELLQRLAKKYGFSKIVISVDHIDGFIVTHGWQESTKTPLLDAINEFVSMGFTEFLLTNVSKDGTMEGPDLEYLEKACAIQNANIIASGGISKIDDVSNVQTKNAFAVILGKALYENKVSIKEAKQLVN
ncbi:1-(5-phosphoribosyl)-5-[(5-phosphoribosylamino)methylideneamino]imidazole-4-carboxamide isomerase [Nitrosopumilus piranensis]|uniref:1-(5-phosphoribosyl)-5-[(5-phosphoribosylamino)methylideneamino] imidazole-4-carboxamide isomerase n=1 Tax=Nitrosopumilus piranensis TaxID=1582439 RepID=A0A0C5BT36_9ARCH|nr:1-(5-phosphoribosyl)-5-[(5-phosphoribosylamino)methylideneamino]imidazole-4-carboxamide isomerase [Nitrosopumilus piranensis]AJM91309.1 1-(5-phosphoribosyl)-5-[(5-phosphoribosylamino)methylideneamino] imidazole-4-carboxamide isomerase [Nitrosopumilus piranensis]